MVNADEYPASLSRPRHVAPNATRFAHVATPARRWPCGPRTNAVARRAARTRNVAEFSPQFAPATVTEGAAHSYTHLIRAHELRYRSTSGTWWVPTRGRELFYEGMSMEGASYGHGW